MTKRLNKADVLIHKSLQKALADNRLHICLITSKTNIPGSPLYNPWESLLPILLPALIGLILIWLLGVIPGIILMAAGIFFSANFIKRKTEHRLLDRARKIMMSDYNDCCHLWDFGGIILVKSSDSKYKCLAPDERWQDFVVLHFSDLMVDETSPESAIKAKSDAQAA